MQVNTFYRKGDFQMSFFKGEICTKTLCFMLAVIAFIMFLVVYFIKPGINFLIVLFLFMLFYGLIGRHTNGRYLGILINDRNVMSLSRFQVAAWTAVVLSAYIVIATTRAINCIPDSLDIDMDYRVWIMMGISVTSLIATPHILANKEEKQFDESTQSAKMAVAEKLTQVCNNLNAEDIVNNSKGLLFANKLPKTAEFTDIFEGDEISNACSVDIAKLQMFFFTMVALVTYSINLFYLIKTNPITANFPTLSEGFLVILGISYGGYVSSKTITNTKIQ